MNYDMVKHERGQVWMIRFKNKNEAYGSEQAKDRPYLVLSVGKFNKSLGMITAVPITHVEKRDTPVHVKFTNDKNITNTILVEQIRSFDLSSGAYILDFMGVLSDDILEKVDVALSIHQGMHYSPITLKSLYDTMEAIIKSVGYMQKKADTPKFSDEDVIAFVEKMQDLASKEISVTSEVAATVTVEEKVTEDKTISESDLMKTLQGSELSKSISKEKTARIKWTNKTCKEFLEDTETLPMKAVMEKWNISKKSKYYSMKQYARNMLLKMTS